MGTENDEAQVIEVQEGEQQTDDQPIDQSAVDAEEQPAAEEGQPTEGELVVTIGDQAAEEEDDQAKAPEWVRNLRKENRELKKRQKELEAQMQRPQDDAPKLGPKPTLADHDYDADQFESALEKWHAQKVKVDQHHKAQEEAQRAQAQEWQAKLEGYTKAKQSLNVQDFDEIEEAVTTTLNQTQQGIILQGAENPAIVVLALGRNEAKARELAEIKDPVKFAFAIAKMETQLKVTNRPKAPPPVTTLSGGRAGGGMAKSVQQQLDDLREKARKTGDGTEVLQFKKKHGIQ